MTMHQGGTTPESKRRQRQMLTGVGAGIVLILLSRALDWFGLNGGGWFWFSTALSIVAAAVLVTAVARFVRWQRADYWREREGTRGRNSGPPPSRQTPQR